jgi:hypothetical protein
LGLVVAVVLRVAGGPSHDDAGVRDAGIRDAGALDGAVSGFVTTEGHRPLANVRVAIGEAVATTDAKGYFSIRNVAPEYDAVLVQDIERYALVVRGASTRTLNLVGLGSDVPHTAGVRGSVAGGAGVPLPAGHVVLASFLSSRTDKPQVRAAKTDGSFLQDSLWYGELEVTGELCALGFEVDAGNHPVGFDGFGTKGVTLSRGKSHGASGGSDPATLVALDSIGERRLRGTLSVPDGYAPELKFFVGPFQTDYLEIAPGEYSTLLPDRAGSLPQYVEVRATRASGEHVLTYVAIDKAATKLDLSAPRAPEQLGPENGKLGVTSDAPFTFTTPPDSVARVTFVFGDWQIDVVTTDGATTFPELTKYGVPSGSRVEGAWRIQSALGVRDVDAWTGAQVLTYGYRTVHDRSGYAWSADRAFTMAP